MLVAGQLVELDLYTLGQRAAGTPDSVRRLFLSLNSRTLGPMQVTAELSENRLSVFADALFDFDKANLRPDAEATLRAALPEIAKATGRPAYVEGHTDGKGSDAYNMKLSEARGRTVRDWLGANGAIPAATPIKAYGKRMPIAPNTTSDGQDDPEGRQKNRRVEIVFETCKS